ncbi:MAG: extracellular solute-binding protein [Clostridia bacterium]|nr:extracellular solute-binding protein [Clostridia bacterium]
MKRIICSILVLLFIFACFAACSEKDPNTGGKTDTKKVDQQTNTPTTTVEPAETKELTNEEVAAPYLESLGDTKYNRDFNILCMQGVGNSEKEIWVENASDEPIDNAVFLRNSAVYDRFGVTITPHPVAPGTLASEVQKDNKANSHSYDLIMANGPDTGSLAQNGYLYNFLDLSETLNLDQPWWDPGTLRDCEIYGKVYFMNGDINILDNDVTWILLFNKDLIKKYDLDEPYQLVYDDKWTLDKFYELITSDFNRASDVGEYDANAYYGFITTNGGGLTNFLYTCDMTTVQINDGTPEIVCGIQKNAEKITKILEWCKKTISDPHLTWFSKNDPAQTKEMFLKDHAMFYSEVLSYIVNLSDMKSDYGVLPTPKYDEAQKDYRTHVDGVGSIISIPANMPEDKKEEVATIIEAMAIYSYIYLTPAYYEVTLKNKKARDPDSTKMIDIILKSRKYDLGYIYNTIGLAAAFKGLVEKGQSGWDGTMQKSEKKAKNALNKIIKQYSKI